MDLRELQNKRNELAGKIKDLAKQFDAANPEGWTAEADATWKQVNADYDAVMAKMESVRKGDEINARLSEIEANVGEVAHLPRPTGIGNLVGGRGSDVSPLAGLSPIEIQAEALQGFMRKATGRQISERQTAAQAVAGLVVQDPEHGKCFELRPVNSLTYNAIQSIYRDVHPTKRGLYLNAALTTTSGSTGGNAIPAETLSTEFERAMLAYGSVRPVARFIQTASGEPLVFASMNDTSNSGRLIAESTLSNDNAGGGSAGDFGPNPSFAKTTWNAYKFTSDTVAFPQELIEDNAFNLLSEVQNAMAERLARITESYYATGTGSAQPEGILQGSHTGKTVASQTAITTAELIDFQHSLDPAYRAGAAWMMHDNLVLYVRKLIDGQSNYIWNPGFNGGIPDTLLGAPVYTNQSFTSTLAQNNYVMVYGQLNKYYIRRAGNLRLYVLNELYRAKDQVGVVAFIREDGGVMNAGGNPIKRLRMAA